MEGGMAHLRGKGAIYFDKAARRRARRALPERGRARPERAAAWLEAGKRPPFTGTDIINKSLKYYKSIY